MTYQPIAVGVDIFQGGFSLGVRRAGFDLACNFEEGSFGNATFTANFPDVPVHIGAENWPTKEMAGQDIDLAYANPPCVVFSAAALSSKAKWRDKAELSCTLLTFDTFERLRPAIAIWECVPRAWTMGRELIDHQTERFLKLGYSVSYVFNDSVFLGCAQRRRRFMFVAHMVEIEPFLPEKPTVYTVRDQIGDMEPDLMLPISEGLANAFRLSGDSHDLRAAWDSMYEKGVDKGRPKMMDHRIEWDRPCSTITGMLSQVHPEADRYLAPNEVSRLCGYPDDWEWVYKRGNGTDFQQQCCKAVLPGAGEYVATMAFRGLQASVLTRNRVRLWDPRKWADWLVADQLGVAGRSRSAQGGPEPAVLYADMPGQLRLADTTFVPALPAVKDEAFFNSLTEHDRRAFDHPPGGRAQVTAEWPKAQPPQAVAVGLGEKKRPVVVISGGARPRPKPNSFVLKPSTEVLLAAAGEKKRPADYPITVIGYDEKGPIRTRKPTFDAAGNPVRRPVGRVRLEGE